MFFACPNLELEIEVKEEKEESAPKPMVVKTPFLKKSRLFISLNFGWLIHFLFKITMKITFIQVLKWKLKITLLLTFIFLIQWSIKGFNPEITLLDLVCSIGLECKT